MRTTGNNATERHQLRRRESAHKCNSPFSGNVTICSNLFSIKKADRISSGSRGMGLTPEHNFAHAQVAVEESESEQGSPQYPILEATKPGEKPRVVVPGSGWAACRFLEGLDVKIYDVVCISPRNHMVFTPLLASTFVGTLEFRLVAEPISRIQTALAKNPNSYFFLASCSGMDTNKHEVAAYNHLCD